MASVSLVSRSRPMPVHPPVFCCRASDYLRFSLPGETGARLKKAKARELFHACLPLGIAFVLFLCTPVALNAGTALPGLSVAVPSANPSLPSNFDPYTPTLTGTAAVGNTPVLAEWSAPAIREMGWSFPGMGSALIRNQLWRRHQFCRLWRKRQFSGPEPGANSALEAWMATAPSQSNSTLACRLPPRTSSGRRTRMARALR